MGVLTEESSQRRNVILRVSWKFSAGQDNVVISRALLILHTAGRNLSSLDHGLGLVRVLIRQVVDVAARGIDKQLVTPLFIRADIWGKA